MPLECSLTRLRQDEVLWLIWTRLESQYEPIKSLGEDLVIDGFGDISWMPLRRKRMLSGLNVGGIRGLMYC